MNQLTEGLKRLGIEPRSASHRDKIKAMEAACPAGGMSEVLYHLEGKKGFTARKLLQEGYSVEEVFFYILHNQPLMTKKS